MKSKMEIKGGYAGLIKTLETLKANGVTFTSGHEVEMDENGNWRNVRRVF